MKFDKRQLGRDPSKRIPMIDNKKIRDACKAFVRDFVEENNSFEDVSLRIRREFDLSESEFGQVLAMYDTQIKAAFDRIDSGLNSK